MQLGTALAVILITYFKLSHITNFSVDAGARTYNVTGTCLLNADTSKADMCVYAYTIAGVSILATLIVSLFLVSCRWLFVYLPMLGICGKVSGQAHLH